MAVALVYITFKNQKEADKIIGVLLKENLIACANTFSVNSVFEWKKKMKKSKEIVAFCKTKPALTNKLEARVKALHSYDIPCIISWTANANDSFERWVLEETADLL